jgi:hypothetical protein
MPTLVASYFLWPAAQIVNFLMVPLDLRVLYTNLVSIAWTAYISNMASGGASAGGAAQEPEDAPASPRAGMADAAAAALPAAAQSLALAAGRYERGYDRGDAVDAPLQPARARRSSGGGAGTTLVA